MRLFGKLIVAAVTAAAAAGAAYYLRKRAQDDAYDLDEFDEDFEDEDTFEDEVEAPAADEAEEAEAAEDAEVVKSDIAEEDKVVLGEGVQTADLDGDGKADTVYVDLRSGCRYG